MISHPDRCIFLHQRKCAGTAIKEAFGLRTEDSDWHTYNDGVLDPAFAERPAGYLVFSIVRNPWDRFVSGWKYCKSTRDRSLRQVLLDPPREGHDYRHLTRPQHQILLDQDGKPVYDVLLHYETLQDDFDQLCERLGRRTQQLAERNRGSHAPYRDYFDDETRRLLAERYARDIELFGYRW
ncbi:MAG: sulfotransferase family 2 domain-containing protein [Panacagrimonas sp.]